MEFRTVETTFSERESEFQSLLEGPGQVQCLAGRGDASGFVVGDAFPGELFA